MAKERILVVDDEEDMLENCSRILDRLGYEPLLESDGGKGVVRFEQEHPMVTLTDLRMPGMDGLEVLRTIRRIDPDALVILFTAFATVETAVEAVKEGAFDYIPKPFSADQLQLVIERALTQRRLLEENRRLREQLTETYRFENIVGRSRPMAQVFDLIKKVAASEANILVVGESGTGKELIARCIHANSHRAARAFVPVDCASLPEHLLESELFGHERGAFTGAIATRRGLFEEANGGTSFLDEVGDIPLQLQAKLLRVLQERQVRRVGVSDGRDERCPPGPGRGHTHHGGQANAYPAARFPGGASCGLRGALSRRGRGLPAVAGGPREAQAQRFRLYL